MIVALVCERMHWDYETYLAQPVWLIDLLISKWDIDAKRTEQREIMR